MFRSVFSKEVWLAKAEAMRRAHSMWLSRSVKHGYRPPRIPVRKVTDGGWDQLMSTPEGRAWAEEFWQGAFEHPDSQ